MPRFVSAIRATLPLFAILAAGCGGSETPTGAGGADLAVAHPGSGDARFFTCAADLDDGSFDYALDDHDQLTLTLPKTTDNLTLTRKSYASVDGGADLAVYGVWTWTSTPSDVVSVASTLELEPSPASPIIDDLAVMTLTKRCTAATTSETVSAQSSVTVTGKSIAILSDVHDDDTFSY